MEQDQLIITQTKKWIQDVVIGLNLCPFAGHVVKQQAVTYIVDRSKDKAVILETLIKACEQLDEDESIETSFIILPDSFQDFYNYLDLVEVAEKLLEEEDYEGIYQLASFHPLYTFASSIANDAADYTNRSVYPMLHLLREASIDKALENFDNPDDIPERNVKFTREKGVAYMKMLRDACMGYGE